MWKIPSTCKMLKIRSLRHGELQINSIHSSTKFKIPNIF